MGSSNKNAQSARVFLSRGCTPFSPSVMIRLEQDRGSFFIAATTSAIVLIAEVTWLTVVLL
jgi:hypothetical protein